MKSKESARSFRFFEAVLSFAVIAAIAASAFNYYSIRTTNRCVLQLEAARQMPEVNTFRYTRLYEVLEAIRKLPDIDSAYGTIVNGKFVDRNKFNRVVEATTQRISEISKLYENVKPILDSSIRGSVDKLMAEERAMSGQLAARKGADAELPESVVADLIQLRFAVEEAFKDAVSRQIELLTAKNTVESQN